MAIIKLYVGLQLVNTGPSANPINNSRVQPVRCALLESTFFEPAFALPDVFSQSDGNKVMSPKKIKIAPEIVVQKLGGIEISAVVALSSNVNSTTENASDPIRTSTGRRRLEPTLPPTIIGKIGSTQGASTVSTPAINEVKNSNMY